MTAILPLALARELTHPDVSSFVGAHTSSSRATMLLRPNIERRHSSGEASHEVWSARAESATLFARRNDSMLATRSAELIGSRAHSERRIAELLTESV